MGLTSTQYTCDADGAVIPQGDPVYRVSTIVEQLVIQDGAVQTKNGNGSTQILCKDHVASAAPIAAPATLEASIGLTSP